MEAWLPGAGPVGLLLVFLTLGLVTGIPAGMFGIGGGLVLVPVLVWLFPLLGLEGPYLVQLAIGTSLGAIVPTAVLSAYGHYQRGGVDPDAVRRLLVPILIGAAGGALLATQLDGRALARIFGGFEIAIALWLLFGLRPRGQVQSGKLIWWSAGTGIGGFSALIGIAGGTLTTPFLLSQGWAIRKAIGSAAALGIPISVAGSLVYATPEGYLGSGPEITWALGYIYLPAVVGIALGAAVSVRAGVWLTHHLPVEILRRAFAGVLLLAGVYMLLR